MPATTNDRDGYEFEAYVRELLAKLEPIGFARDIRVQDHVADRDGNVRKVDISFILVTWAVEILVSIECKSKSRPISLDDVDQLKTFKQELPERNIFWLVYEGTINEHVRHALKRHGISAYSREELTRIVKAMVRRHRWSRIKSQRKNTEMLSMMNPLLYEMSAAGLRRTELHVLSDFEEVVATLKPYGFQLYYPCKR